MTQEFQFVVDIGTWTLVPSIHVTNLIGYKWNFYTKLKLGGSIERQKATLVAKGFHQQVGIDYIETFSLVVKFITIWLVISRAKLHKIDI